MLGVMLSLLLTACTTTISKCQPEMVYFTKEDATQMASYLETLPQEHIVFKYIIGYKVLREQVRYCQEN